MAAPFFSVVIPTLRRREPLRACLDGFTAVEYPNDRFEVIVVDDGSGAPPADVVGAFEGRFDVTLETTAWGGPGAARNAGAARARGEYLAFIDDDCVADPGWLWRLAERLRHVPEAAIGGCTINGLPRNPYSTASQMLASYLYDYYARDENRERRFFATNNLALSVRQFQLVGGFDTTVLRDTAEDRDLCDRWRLHGFDLVYAPEAIVYHAHVLSFASFWRQHYRYGQGALYFHRARAHRGGGRLRVEPLSFYLGLIRSPEGSARGGTAARLSALLAMSQTAYVAGYLLEFAKNVLSRAR